MAQRVYATQAEFSTWDAGTLYAVPSDAVLRRASVEIDGLTLHSVYDVDEDGYPTDADITEAFRDATCAQAAWWDETDDITGAQSQDGTFSIGSVSIGASGRTKGGASADAAQSRISPEAVQILVNAGLIRTSTAHT